MSSSSESSPNFDIVRAGNARQSPKGAGVGQLHIVNTTVPGVPSSPVETVGQLGVSQQQQTPPPHQTQFGQSYSQQSFTHFQFDRFRFPPQTQLAPRVAPIRDFLNVGQELSHNQVTSLQHNLPRFTTDRLPPSYPNTTSYSENPNGQQIGLGKTDPGKRMDRFTGSGIDTLDALPQLLSTINASQHSMKSHFLVGADAQAKELESHFSKDNLTSGLIDRGDGDKTSRIPTSLSDGIGSTLQSDKAMSPLSVIPVSYADQSQESPASLSYSNTPPLSSQQLRSYRPAADQMLSAINYNDDHLLPDSGLMGDNTPTTSLGLEDTLLNSGIGVGTAGAMRLGDNPSALDSNPASVNNEPFDLFAEGEANVDDTNYISESQTLPLSPQTFSTEADTTNFASITTSLSGSSSSVVSGATDTDPNQGGAHVSTVSRTSVTPTPGEKTEGTNTPEVRPKPKKGRPRSGQSGPRSLACPECAKVFSSSSALAKHKLIHSDERKHVCQLCGKGFKRQDHLSGHMLTHRTQKPYACPVQACEKSYCDARSLRRHMESQHAGNALSTTPVRNNQTAMNSEFTNVNHNYDSNKMEDTASSSAALHYFAMAATSDKRTDGQNAYLTAGFDQDSQGSNRSDEQEHGMGLGGKNLFPVPSYPAGIAGQGMIPRFNLPHSDEEKVAECSVCKKTFKSIPALNGHMRLHGGYERNKPPEMRGVKDQDHIRTVHQQQQHSTDLQETTQLSRIQHHTSELQEHLTKQQQSTLDVKEEYQDKELERRLQQEQEQQQQQHFDLQRQQQQQQLQQQLQQQQQEQQRQQFEEYKRQQQQQLEQRRQQLQQLEQQKQLQQLEQQRQQQQQQLEAEQQRQQQQQQLELERRQHVIEYKQQLEQQRQQQQQNQLEQQRQLEAEKQRQKLQQAQVSQFPENQFLASTDVGHRFVTPTSFPYNLPVAHNVQFTSSGNMPIRPTTSDAIRRFIKHEITRLPQQPEKVKSEQPQLFMDNIPNNNNNNNPFLPPKITVSPSNEPQPPKLTKMIDGTAEQIKDMRPTTSPAKEMLFAEAAKDMNLKQEKEKEFDNVEKRNGQAVNSTGKPNLPSKEKSGNDVFRNPTRLPASPTKKRHRPDPIIIPSYVHTGMAGSPQIYQSQMRSPRDFGHGHGFGHGKGTKGMTPPPYTPPPMLSPIRTGSGLYFNLTSANSGNLPTPRSALIPPLTPKTPSMLQLHRQSSINEKEAQDVMYVEPKINVGDEYQAQPPSFKTNRDDLTLDRVRETLVWHPNTELLYDDDEIENFLDFACSAAIPGGASNSEYAVHCLQRAKGDVMLALNMVINKNPMLLENDPMRDYHYTWSTLWSKKERIAFKHAYIKNGKDFHLIQKEVKTKTVQQCIEYYYKWKKLFPKTAYGNIKFDEKFSVKTRISKAQETEMYEDDATDSEAEEKEQTYLHNTNGPHRRSASHVATHIATSTTSSHSQYSNTTSTTTTGHSTAATFLCDFPNCTAKFASRQALNGHIRVHGGGFTKPFPAVTTATTTNTVNHGRPTNFFREESDSSSSDDNDSMMDYRDTPPPPPPPPPAPIPIPTPPQPTPQTKVRQPQPITGEEFPCRICGKVFYKVKSRSAHMKSHRKIDDNKGGKTKPAPVNVVAPNLYSDVN